MVDLGALVSMASYTSMASNIIYLDSPAGTGFSYSQNETDYDTGDFKTAADTHAFLLKWFQLYPEFLSNPYFIAGESYAGIYVPTLASEAVKGIDSGTKPRLNFKGYLVGNGCTDDKFDGLISDDLYENQGYTLQEVEKECNGTFYDPGPSKDICNKKLSAVELAISELNVYDILEPCYHGKVTAETKRSNDRLPASFRMLGETERPLPVRKRMFGRAWPLSAPVRDGIVPTWPQLNNNGYVPCFDDEVATTWSNNAEVRKAIHATEVKMIETWELCTDRIRYNHDAGSMITYHKNLTSKGYRALIYSGDHDMCVPFTGSEAWTRSMGYKIVDEWRPWISNEQVAGYF
ncbi:hypothetical protein L6164_000325 [Bauhinia variegata]|uniref:Uncharacterized protein n=1 Tax=Bauhinia variegata TaxID=167791 RepID=A0ACB9Q667_BAUVA|nr:hypothetical protein L6164_000325 [Bauhinia variegata]